MSTPKKKKPGRPVARIDPVQVLQLAALQATDEEMAAFFRIDRRTLIRRRKSKDLLSVTDPEGNKFRGTFAEIIERGRATGRLSVRRNLFRLAQGKQGVAAAIFLAKNLLGYRDVAELTGKDGESLIPRPPIPVVIQQELLRAVEERQQKRSAQKTEPMEPIAEDGSTIPSPPNDSSTPTSSRSTKVTLAQLEAENPTP